MPKIKRLTLRTALACTFLTASLTAPALAKEAPAQPVQPNFLVIVADDLGYSDLGAFGGEISTPNLDALALSGVRLTGFHTAPTCSPTRSMLMSGTDNHRAGLGNMAEATAPNQRGKPGYEGYLRADVAALPERLQAAGYTTLFSGKWHLGLTPEQDPHSRGFEHSFALLQGAHNHFGLGLSTETPQALGKGSTYTEDGRVLSSLPADFYSSDYFATKLISQLQAAQSEDAGKKPFFAYLAFTAPHWPLQAPADDVARYKGRYDQGFEILRQERLKRQEKLGLVPAGTAAHTPDLKKDWASLTAEQKQAAARDMEIYAAMVDRLDQNVGRVIAELKRSGELDNTVIVFLADNGAEGLTEESPLLAPRVAQSDNSFANRGKANSFVAYGPGWAQAATAPSWKIKGYATEGGTRVVSFVSGKAVAKPGSVATAFLSVADIAPTLLDLAGAPAAGETFGGKPVQPITGKSWVPYLRGQTDRVYGAQDAFGTELFGSRAIRQGDWKITDAGDGQWRLFNVAKDPGETQDLAASHPDQLKKLAAEWDSYAKNVGIILPDNILYRP
ncbi:MAG: arylsulfatase [Novosphingobium sp.]